MSLTKKFVPWAIVVFVGLWISLPLLAQESGKSSASNSSSASSVAQRTIPSSQAVRQNSAILAAEQRIDAALDQRLNRRLSFDGEMLTIVCEMISEEYTIPILFDKAALDEVGVSPESEVQCELDGITLRSALNHLFREPGLEDLAYAIEDEVLLITTKDQRDEMLKSRVYRVDDLLTESEPGVFDDVSPLIDAIVSCVEQDAWMENGTGHGEVQYIHPGLLIVSQPGHIQKKIANFLQQVRETKRQILQANRPQ